jgi:hypothetical protein
LIGTNTECLDEALPTRCQRQSDGEFEDLTFVEVPAELPVVLISQCGMRRREDVDQSKSDDSSFVEIATVELTHGLLYFVFG